MHYISLSLSLYIYIYRYTHIFINNVQQRFLVDLADPKRADERTAAKFLSKHFLGKIL